MEPKRIDGVLDPFWETGTEGIVWSVYGDRANSPQLSYDKLHTLRDGDRLIIYAPDNETVVFDDFINLVWQPSCEQDPATGVLVERPYQTALGFVVNGVQMGLNPDEWARFFFPREWYGGAAQETPDLWATLYQAPRPTRRWR